MSVCICLRLFFNIIGPFERNYRLYSRLGVVVSQPVLGTGSTDRFLTWSRHEEV